MLSFLSLGNQVSAKEPASQQKTYELLTLAAMSFLFFLQSIAKPSRDCLHRAGGARGPVARIRAVFVAPVRIGYPKGSITEWPIS